jgi:hypothetical protein
MVTTEVEQIASTIKAVRKAAEQECLTVGGNKRTLLIKLPSQIIHPMYRQILGLLIDAESASPSDAVKMLKEAADLVQVCKRSSIDSYRETQKD